MIDDIISTLKMVGISFSGPYECNRLRNLSAYTSYQLDISGMKNLNQWMRFIGFRNPKHLVKLRERDLISSSRIPPPGLSH